MVDVVFSQIRDFVEARPLLFITFLLIGTLWTAFVMGKFKYPGSRSELHNSIKKWAPKVMLSSLPAMFTLGMIGMLLSSNSGHNLFALLLTLVCGTIGMGVTFAFTALRASSTYYKGKRNSSSS